MTFYLADTDGGPSYKLDFDYRTAKDNEDISEEDMRTIDYYGELHEAKEEMEEAIQEAKKAYYEAVKIITNYYRNFRGVK